jgi:hypothetical protein
MTISCPAYTRAGIRRPAMLFTLAGFLLLAGCTKPDPPVPANPPAETANTKETEEDRAVLEVSKAIRGSHLTALADECLSYRFDDSAKESELVEVRENHQSAVCAGDPNLSPRLFSVKIDRRSRQMSTDAGSPGEFHPMGR